MLGVILYGGDNVHSHHTYDQIIQFPVSRAIVFFFAAIATVPNNTQGGLLEPHSSAMQTIWLIIQRTFFRNL